VANAIDSFRTRFDSKSYSATRDREAIGTGSIGA
jgi:hypothetical protein